MLEPMEIVRKTNVEGGSESTAHNSTRARRGPPTEAKDASDGQTFDELQPEVVLAQSITLARTRLGLTQEQLAQRIGTTQSAISRLESGRAKPSLNLLIKVAEALEVRLVARLGQR